MSVNYDSIMNDFINESNELLDRAETDVLTLEQEGFSDDLVNGIFRAIHTIKGNAGLFELNRISSLAHSLESMLNLVRNRELSINMEIIDLSLASVDRLREMIKNVGESESFDVADLTSRLDRIRGVEPAGSEQKKEAAPAPTRDSSGSVADESSSKSSPAGAPGSPDSNSGPGEESFLPGKEAAPVSIHPDEKLKIPSRLVEEARTRGSVLTLLQVDLSESNLGILQIREELQRRSDTGELRLFGSRLDRIRILEDSTEPSLPVYLVIERKGSVEDNELFLGTRPSSIRELVKGSSEEKKASRPGNSPEKARQQAPESNEESEVIGSDAPESGPAEEAPVPVAREENIPVPVGDTVSEGEKEQSGMMEIHENESVPEIHAENPSAELHEKKPAGKDSKESADSHLRVPIKLIDSLINLAGETVIARNELMQRITENRDAALESVGKRMSFLITRLQEGIMRTRLQELNTVFQKIPRIVRDAALNTGKQVELVMDGGEVELDKTLIDAIGDSIMHIIRNSVDHGIEPPEERKKYGKKPEGYLKVSAILRGGNVVLTIRDDGRGLNLEKIRQKAIAQNVISKEAAQNLSREEIAELVFEPGLSTADKVTRTSGRGVGMDVVRSNLKKVGGSVEIVSESGKGTTITATLPQTLSIVTCLMIRSCGQLYALPQQNVLELILLDREQLREVEGHEVYDLRGHLLPILNLGKTLDLNEYEKADPTHIVVVRSERHHFGLLIDEVVNLEEIVVKRLGEHFAGLTFFSGAAILGDGESVLILDVPGLAKFSNLQANLQEMTDDEIRAQREGTGGSAGHLIFSVYGQQFGVAVDTVPRIEKITGKDIDIFMGIEVIRYRGEVVPIVRLDEIYDLELDAEDRNELYVIIFNIDGMRTGIVSSEIHNVVDSLPEVDDHTFAGQSVRGHTIVGEDVILILDALDLLSRLQATRFKEIARQVKRKGGEKGERKKEGPVELDSSNLTSGLGKLRKEVAAQATTSASSERPPFSEEVKIEHSGEDDPGEEESGPVGARETGAASSLQGNS